MHGGGCEPEDDPGRSAEEKRGIPAMALPGSTRMHTRSGWLPILYDPVTTPFFGLLHRNGAAAASAAYCCFHEAGKGIGG